MVAKEAGMATGSLYNYFENKNELIDYALDRICNGFFEAIRANAQDGTPSERIRSIIGCCFEFVTEKHSIFIDCFKLFINEFHKIYNKIIFKY